MAILVDLPDAILPDNPAWARRRALAAQWARSLQTMRQHTGLDVSVCFYRNVRRNNADLPARAWLLPVADGNVPQPSSADDLDETTSVPFDQVLSSHTILLAPTELSATAPLKLSAPRHGFRAATMPGFSEDMIPALRLDYGEIHRHVARLASLLDAAQAADFVFLVDGTATHHLQIDLRFRFAHASGGVIDQPGTAGNLPSGEAYIVPYEGERPGEPSRSEGELPVQFADGLVVYRIENNRAMSVAGDVSAALAKESSLLAAEPAYGNLAELGLGVLADFGIEPTGEVLLDEKLGPHIAFGRSDHFGGVVGASAFSSPNAVVHIDRVFVRAMQPRVAVQSIDLLMNDGRKVELMRNDRYVL